MQTQRRHIIDTPSLISMQYIVATHREVHTGWSVVEQDGCRSSIVDVGGVDVRPLLWDSGVRFTHVPVYFKYLGHIFSQTWAVSDYSTHLLHLHTNVELSLLISALNKKDGLLNLDLLYL